MGVYLMLDLILMIHDELPSSRISNFILRAMRDPLRPSRH